MEQWQDQGILLSLRRHGENGAIVTILTREHGLYAGYVRGAQSSRMRGVLEPGNIVDANWNARNAEDLGTYTLEVSGSPSSHFMDDPLRLGALQSACALCVSALPEREGHAGLYHGLRALLSMLEQDVWDAGYVMWEVAFLKELGFSLDLLRCAGGGQNTPLSYVSPKTGRAVSQEVGEPYKDKLLNLPKFLMPDSGGGDPADILTGLEMSGYFMEHWVYAHHTRGIPDERLRFVARFAKYVEDMKQNEDKIEETEKQHDAG